MSSDKFKIQGIYSCENRSANQYFISVHTGFFYGGIPDTLAANMALGGILLILAALVWSAKHLAFQKQFSLKPDFGLKELWMWTKGNESFFFWKYGNQNAQYLLFQRYIMLLLLSYCTLDIGILLPINIFAGKNSDPSHFEASIITNLNINSQFLWIHLIHGFFKLPIALGIMTFYCHKTLRSFEQPILLSQQTIVLQRVPEQDRTEAAISKILMEKCPSLNIENVCLTYNMKKILSLQKKIGFISEVCKSHNLSNITDKFLFTRRSPVSVKQLYRIKLEKLYQNLHEVHREVVKEPLDIVFVQLQSSEEVEKVMNSWNCLDRGIFLEKSPNQEDVEYTNMIDYRDRIWRCITNGVVLVIVMVFFTTPQTILAIFEDYSTPLSKEVSAWKTILETIIPSILRMSIEYMITNIIAWAVGRSGLWSKVTISKCIFKYTTLLLLLNLMILPMAGFKTVEEILLFFLRSSNHSGMTEGKYARFKCAFLPMGGASFIELIITDAVIGNVFELFRLADFGKLLWQLAIAKSAVEQRILEKLFRMEFSLAQSYSHEMFVLTVCVGMSSSTPLILPFGLMYFAIRHCILSYNFQRKDLKTTVVDLSFHKIAISYVVGSTIYLQLFFCTYILVGEYESGSNISTMGAVSTILPFISMLIWGMQCRNGWKFPLPVSSF